MIVIFVSIVERVLRALIHVKSLYLGLVLVMGLLDAAWTHKIVMMSRAEGGREIRAVICPQPLFSVILDVLEDFGDERLGIHTPVGRSVHQLRNERQPSLGVKGAMTVAEGSCGKSPWQLPIPQHVPR